MIATRRGNCTACPHRIRPGESVATDGLGGWRHVECPPARVMFVCECGVQTPCECGDNSLAQIGARRV